jgi:uncharacterized protein (DUF1778 family)
MEPRTDQIIFKVSPEEKELIRNTAAVRGQNMSEMLRDLVLDEVDRITSEMNTKGEE